ncbi:MAG: hypothetical protein K2I89_07520 [Muribaculaceae bacterium]|nr:hypothetical protein [Muribaculaceae bacterium]
MSDNTNDRREELCNRFRQSLSGDSSSQYFDEDELIEIFDYAGDLNDDYLRMEVLLCGARYYPESVALKQRRALLYHTFGDDLTSKYLQDNADSHGVLWDISRIRNANLMGAEAITALDNILTAYGEFDDEEVIQLVDLASSLGQTDWLLDRLDALRAHVTYLPTLLYEIAVMLEMEQRYGEAIKLLEELTEIEPYNEQYWFMLAQEYDIDDNVAGALQALDLALAILPGDKAMRFYQARLLARDDNGRQHAIEALERLSEDYPDDIDINRFLAALYIECAPDGDEKARKAAAETLLKCFAKNKGNRKLASDLMAIDAAPSEKLIAEVDKADAPGDINGWLLWAGELEALGAYDKAIDILSYCDRKLGYRHPSINEALIVDYFQLEDFASVCSTFQRPTVGASAATPDVAALVFVAYAISLAKIGRLKEAAEFSKMILKLVVEEGPDDITYALRRLGTGLILTDIIERCSSHVKTNWAEYDPFGLWLKN